MPSSRYTINWCLSGKESAWESGKNILQETGVWSPGQEDPLEKEMATHSSVLPGESHGQRSVAGYSPWGRTRVGHDWAHT